MTVQYLAAILVVITYIAFCLFCWMRYRRSNRAPHMAAVVDGIGQVRLLIAYASQTGSAQQIAVQSAAQLTQAGMAVTLLPLNRVDQHLLMNTRQALFVVSTYGEGEPPDTGVGFLRRYRSTPGEQQLSHLQFGILALGDSAYRHFCGFGHALNQALHHQGAKASFDLVEVDKNDEAALRHWQYYLGQLSGQPHFVDWKQPTYDQWLMRERHCLNPQSPGNPAFHIQLIPESDGIENQLWQAGDIAEVGPCNAIAQVESFINHLSLDARAGLHDQKNLRQVLSRRRLPESEAELQSLRGLTLDVLLQQLPELPHREYSIASLPQDGTLDLLVRQQRQADGRLGLGSGWLTEYSQPGDKIALRIRINTGFHPPRDDVPLILIGNGTGLAGLRAHLRARARLGRSRNWLLFGERTRAHDFFFADEIMRWHRGSHLHTLDIAFSRDQTQVCYVQHLLLQKRTQVMRWVEEGAAIYVCGSLQGMAQGVDDALSLILGGGLLETLAESGRYCRDIY